MNLTVCEDTLLHGETLLVVSSSDADDVSLPLITKKIGFDLSSHALLIEHTKLVVIHNFDELLGPRGGVGNVQL